MMVCGLFCVFWLSFGLLQLPTLGLATAYSATGNAAEGAISKEMNAVIALYLLVWGFALGTFWLFTIRINAIFAGIFGFVTIGAWVLSGAYWKLSQHKFDDALKLQKVYDPPPDKRDVGRTANPWVTLGWRGFVVYCGNVGLVHDHCNHGCRDAVDGEFASGRFKPLLERD